MIPSLESVKAATKITAWIAPLSLAQIREQLITAMVTGVDSVPEWQYAERSLQAPRDELLALVESEYLWRVGNDRLDEEIREMLHAQRAALAVFEGNSDRGFSDWSRETYGLPSPQTREVATKMVADFHHVNPKSAHDDDGGSQLEPDKAAAEIRRVLDAHGLIDWDVEVNSSMAARMSVVANRTKVKVDGSAVFSADEIRRLLVHEVGTHVFRSVNAQAQPTAIASMALRRAAETEEGFAVWHEEQFDVSGPSSWLKYAARVLAVEWAAVDGVVQVAKKLEPILGLNAAAAMAIRVKRGLQDPNQPGGYTKDHSYLSGYLSVKQHLAKNPHHYRLLMSTKWPLSLLPLAQQLTDEGMLQGPRLLPKKELFVPNVWQASSRRTATAADLPT